MTFWSLIYLNTPIAYGQTIQLGKGAPNLWPYYVVANVARVIREPLADNADEVHISYEVYLAKQNEWESFGEPMWFGENENL